MSGRALRACARKEALLLWRDPQTLLLLFVMPAVFILVMSLALQDRFQGGASSVATALVVDADASASASRLVAGLGDNAGFEIVEAGESLGVEGLRARLRAAGHEFGLRIAPGFEEAVGAGEGRPADHLRVLVAPAVDRQREALFVAAIRQGLARLRMDALAERLAPMAQLDPARMAQEIPVSYLYGGPEERTAPSSVQQNVPAWLVFGIFFVVIPLSNTMIRERQSGMERRLRTTPAGAGSILAGKLLPYFVLNQLQAAIMLCVGIFLVPALGGRALELSGVSAATLLTMTVAVSLAALGYALLVSAVSRTTEQAAMLGGGGNIILAAIGGIMVPVFVMPPALQALTQISPMAWGLNGYLLAFLEHGDPADVAGHAGALAAFGAAGIALAWWLQAQRAE